jgi:hypothetical protein
MNIYGGGKILNTYERVKYRPIEDNEIKALFEKIKLNTDFSLPDKLIQDFINDGSIAPTFKKCANFNNNDFQHIIIHIIHAIVIISFLWHHLVHIYLQLVFILFSQI